MEKILWAAVATAVPVMVLVPILKNLVSAKLIAATALVAMSFIYVGFALGKNSAEDIALESIVAILFYFVAVIGYKKESRLIALGILFHGIWDSIHHFTSAAEDSPVYWSAYCLTVDVIWSIYFYILFSRSRRTLMAAN